MSNYTKTTNFAAKDSLPSGNAAKIVKGAEIDTEFNNIATASATKANANNAALTGTTVFATLSDGTIAITGWVDEDNMASNSAVLIPTQQSVKAYVDSNVTAQDLDVTDGTTSIDIDLDSESLGILGGTGITSSASGTGVTLAIDSTVTTLTGTQTLSNKTLTTPVISGALTTNSTIDGRDVAVDGTKLDGIESGATADQTAAEIKTAYESNANTNAFTDADESKLDGIEASADVTDTTNVTAAGALMDSELTNITAVKALNQGVATGDSPTFAGVTAPLTGNVTGNLTGNVTGNVTGDLTGDVTGNVAGNLTGSVLTAAQTNITSVGNLTSLQVIDGDFNVLASEGAGAAESLLIADVSTKRVGVNKASPSVSLDIGSNTDAVHVPTGTTAQRPTGAAGYFRYNSNLEQFEGYTTEWGSIGGGGGTNTFTADSFTGNGSTTAYALSQVTSSEDNLLVFIEGVFQQQDAYSIATSSGTTTLTFSAAPANGNAILIYSVAAAVSGSNLNIDSMTGDGSDTTLTLSIAPVNENNTQVFIDGVYQSKANYSISGTTLTFSTAPPTGTAVEVMTFTQTDINVPVDGTITSAKLSGALTTPSDLTVNGVSKLKAGSTSTPADTAAFISNAAAKLVVNHSNEYGAYVGYANSSTDAIGIQSTTSGGTTGPLLLNPYGGSVGIGTSSPDSYYSKELVVAHGTEGGITLVGNPTTATGYLMFADGTTGDERYRGYIGYSHSTPDVMVFGTAGSGKMRIDASGNLLVGTSSNLDFSGVVASHNFTQTTNGRWIAGFRNATTGTPWGISIQYSATAPNSTSSNFLYLTDSAGLRCSVMSNGGVQNYQSNDLNLSDRREKTNFLPAKSYLDAICAIPVQTFNYIDQNMEEDPSVTLGLVAQDVQPVAPELVKESNWGTEEDPKMRLSIYQTDLQYALMKCIQEQQAIIESQAAAITDLTTRLTALENN